MAQKGRPLPAGLARAAGQFAAWRRRRTGRKIPARLWRLATDLARRHGLSATVRALKVQYYDLESRVRGEPVRAGASPAFVELVPPPRGSGSRCTVQIEDRHGTKVSLEIEGVSVADLIALGQVLRGRGT